MDIPDNELISKLGKAISATNYAGTNVREDAALYDRYLEIKDLRSEARSAERRIAQGEQEDKPLDLWRQVLKQADDIFMHHSKDLEIMAWAIEASLRLHGFNGLWQRFELLAYLIDEHWHALYPSIDENKPEALSLRLAGIAGLNGIEAPGTLIPAIFANKLTEGVDGYQYWQYQQAIQAAQLPNSEQREKREKKLGYSLDTIKQARDASSEVFYKNLLADLSHALTAYGTITQLFTKKCGKAAPPSSYIQSALEQALQEVQFLLNDSKKQSVISTKEVLVQTDEAPASPPKQEATTETILDNIQQPQTVFKREEVLAQLTSIANIFEQHEPHSPIPSLLRRAVSLGKLSFKELLQELINSKESLSNVYQLSGIKPD